MTPRTPLTPSVTLVTSLPPGQLFSLTTWPVVMVTDSSLSFISRQEYKQAVKSVRGSLLRNFNGWSTYRTPERVYLQRGSTYREGLLTERVYLQVVREGLLTERVYLRLSERVYLQRGSTYREGLLTDCQRGSTYREGLLTERVYLQRGSTYRSSERVYLQRGST